MLCCKLAGLEMPVSIVSAPIQSAESSLCTFYSPIARCPLQTVADPPTSVLSEQSWKSKSAGLGGVDRTVLLQYSGLLCPSESKCVCVCVCVKFSIPTTPWMAPFSPRPASSIYSSPIYSSASPLLCSRSRLQHTFVEFLVLRHAFYSEPHPRERETP